MSKNKSYLSQIWLLYGLVFMVPIAPVSLYGVVYNLSHGMVALVYIIGAIAMFLPPTAIQHYQSTSHPPGRLYTYAGVCINPAVGFSPDGFCCWIICYSLRWLPSRRCCCSCNTSANTDLGMAVNLCGYRNGHKLFGNTNKQLNSTNCWSLFNLGILAILWC